MSNTEMHTGFLREIDLEGFSLEEKCKELCDQHNMQISEWYASYKDLLEDRLSNWYIILNNKIYRIDDNEVDDDYYCNITEHDDGSYTYVARFYNGGTCLHECLENELNKF